MQETELQHRLRILEQLAEQDLLSASASLDPVYWHQQALERLEIYHRLQEKLRVSDAQTVLSLVADEYFALLETVVHNRNHRREHGKRQALEMVLLLAKTCDSSNVFNENSVNMVAGHVLP